MDNNTSTNLLSVDLEQSLVCLIEQASQYLCSISDSAKLDAQLLLAFVLQKETSYLLTWPEKKLTVEQFFHYQELLIRRHQGEPIAYILGVKEFWSLPFFVSPATLIPRPDTETLIELVLDLSSESDVCNHTPRCLDLGTGTGAIALSLASEKPYWLIEAIDFSDEAVLLAKKNAQSLNLPQVNIYQSDWFSNVDKSKKFDFIVSNPPYIDCQDEHLNQGDVRFEPKSALVAEQKGLADIIKIADQAREYLTPTGRLFFEHGYDQGTEVRDILNKLRYKNIETVKDLSGNDRITWARIA